MQRLLVLSYTTLIALLLGALGVPLALSFTASDYHHLAIARLNDTARFAVQAAAVLRGEDPPDSLAVALRAYETRTGAAVVLVDRAGTQVVASRPSIVIADARSQHRLTRARAGIRSEALDYPNDTHAEPLFIAEPVESGGATLGAVATISPTAGLRSRGTVRLVVLTAVILLGLAAAVLIARPLTRWIMRPVRLLDRAAVAVAAGRYDVRAPQDIGPPEMRRLVRAFNTMADRLVSLVRAQRTFVADASHQLRNPLAALRLRVESLEPFVTQPGRPALDATVTEVKRLASILDALLRLAGAQARQASPQRIDVLTVATERLAAWQAVADEHSVQLRLSGAAATTCCPPGIVDQVLDVLLDNAVGLAPAGSTVRMWTAPTADTVEIHVADQGPGMTPEDKARACDRFWRGQGADERDGWGLGLAIACTLLDTVGGSLAFHDVRPRGLDVVVRLPVWRAKDDIPDPRSGADATADQSRTSS